MNKTFKSKLILSYIIVIAVSFFITAFFLDKNLEKNSLLEIQSALTTQARLIESRIPAAGIRKGDSSTLESLVEELKSRTISRITIIAPDGKVLADSEKTLENLSKMENHRGRAEIMAALTGATGIDIRYSNTLKINMLYVALPFKENKEIIGVLRLALPLKDIETTLFTIRKTVFSGFLVGLLFAFIVGAFVAGRTTRPINALTEIAHKYAEGDFGKRMHTGSSDEIGRLGETLNKMAQKIEDSVRKIKSQNQELAAVLNSMIEGVLVTDKDGHIVTLNPSMEKIFSVSAGQVRGKLFIEAIRNNIISDIINKTLKTGAAASDEISLLLPVKRVFQINAGPLFENAAVCGSLVVIHDITEIKKLENMRKDFVANVSHELRTPLTSIKGFVETLLEGAIDDKENNRNFLEIIQDHAERLNSLVDDLLSLSYLESKEIALHKKEAVLKDEADTVIAGFRMQSKKRKIEIHNDLPPDLRVMIDPEKIGHVFSNLIDNALKFNKDNGSITIYSQPLPGYSKIVIEDSGIGIPEKDTPRVFERFYRVDKGRSRKLGGTGLGLSIVKHIIELHGGSVGVESTEGLGSKFFFTLPK